MPKRIFTVATSHDFNIDGIKILSEPVRVTESFSHIFKPVGEGRLFKEDGVLKCEADIDDIYLLATPALACQINQNDDENGFIKKCIALEVGLCFG